MHQVEITIFILYAPNIGAPNFIKQTLLVLKAQIDSNIIIFGDINTPLSPLGSSSRKKSTKKPQS
jgi:hypothetical protein